MQHKAILWISGIFRILPTMGIEAISGLVPIYLHLKKLYNRFLLRGSSLLSNHIIISILSTDGSYKHIPYNIFIDNLTSKQRLCLNSPFINMDYRCNKLFPSFSAFNKEFNPGNQLIDFFQINSLFTHVLQISRTILRILMTLYSEYCQTLHPP